jgi:hypothetical protein
MSRQKLKEVLEMNISFEDYGNPKENSIPELFKQFMDEYFYAHGLRQYTYPQFISEWLRGLPSTVDMPFYTYDIVNLMKAVDYEVDGMEDIDVDTLYWKELGEIIFENK